MAINITPGYDFGATEVPTRDKLSAVAANLQITGIPRSQFATTLLSIAINDSTDATNLPGEGSLWMDELGSLWGRTRHGDVRVRRAEGGWETNRFRAVGSTGSAGAPDLQGTPGRMTVTVANGTNITEAVIASASDRSDTGTQLHPVISQDSAGSQPLDGTSMPRWCGRGFTPMFTHVNAVASGFQNARLKYAPVFGLNWILEDMFVNGSNIQAETAQLLDDNTHSTEVRGYFMGLPVRDRDPGI